MKLHFFIFVLICSFLSSQTIQQKDRAYKNFESKCRSTTLKGIPKPQWVDKESYLKLAVFYPIYRIDYNPNTKKQEWNIDNDKFLVIYGDYLTYFIDSGISDYNKSYSQLNVQNKFASLLLELDKKKSGVFKIGYLTDEYYPATGTFPNLILEENLKFTDKEHTHFSIEDVISTHYSSMEKYLTKKEEDILRKNLPSLEIIRGIKAYFHSFEYYCPKDTSLVLDKYIEHFDIGTGGLNQKQKRIILEKLSTSFSENMKINDSNAKRDISDFSIYNVDFSDFMKKNLKPKQLSNYEEYMNVHFPKFVHERYGRYIYGELALINSKVVRGFDVDSETQSLPYFNEFIKQQLIDCGCQVESRGFQIKPVK